jgi:hypothetical protein
MLIMHTIMTYQETTSQATRESLHLTSYLAPTYLRFPNDSNWLTPLRMICQVDAFLLLRDQVDSDLPRRRDDAIPFLLSSRRHCWQLPSIIHSPIAYCERLSSSALFCPNHQTDALRSRPSPRYDLLCSDGGLLCDAALLRQRRFLSDRCLLRHERTLRSLSRLVCRRPWADGPVVLMSAICRSKLSLLHRVVNLS